MYVFGSQPSMELAKPAFQIWFDTSRVFNRTKQIINHSVVRPITRSDFKSHLIM